METTITGRVHFGREKKASAQGQGITSDIAIISFLQTTLVSALWIVDWFILKNIRYWVGYRSAESIALITTLSLAALIMLALLIPPVYVGKNRGVSKGLLTFTLTTVWLALGVLLALTFGSTSGPLGWLGG